MFCLQGRIFSVLTKVTPKKTHQKQTKQTKKQKNTIMPVPDHILKTEDEFVHREYAEKVITTMREEIMRKKRKKAKRLSEYKLMARRYFIAT